ncbi:hypothetical protein, partial [Hydrogenophaga sp. OTU3427]|uniref:hypothetical protein n=1 Tax=Hydrogenophaga sp. OTU3427 TaxID=3043856 RepID=UPI00313B7B43
MSDELLRTITQFLHLRRDIKIHCQDMQIEINQNVLGQAHSINGAICREACKLRQKVHQTSGSIFDVITGSVVLMNQQARSIARFDQLDQRSP